MQDKKIILTKEVAAAKLQRLALEVAEQLSGEDAPLIIIGIKEQGVFIAEKISALLKPYINFSVDVITMSMNKQQPGEILLDKQTDFTDKNILLTDDVCITGTARRIQTLVLVERMHKLFPVKPDYVGLSVATTLSDFIYVQVNGDDVAAEIISEP